MLRLVVLLALAAAVPAAVVQLDVCNMHARVSTAPSMALSVKDGTCTVSSMAMAGTSASSSSTSSSSSKGCTVLPSNEAVVLSFPCRPRPSAAVKQAVGPAVNIWASLQDTQLTAAAGATAAAPAATGSCNLTTLNPGLYFHRSPPLYLYGYSVRGLQCQRVQLGLAALQQTAGTTSYAPQNGMWLLPSLPAPPKDLSTAKQSCHIVIELAAQSYISNATFPCSMTPSPFEQLGGGCCYDPLRRRRQ